MNKEREILIKPDGKKIILYPDGSWYDFNELIDTEWLFVFSSSARLIDIHSLHFKPDGLFFVPSSINKTIEAYYNWKKNWVFKNDLLQLKLENNENHEMVFLKGELVFAKSQRLFIGEATAKLINKATRELQDLSGKFTATEIE